MSTVPTPSQPTLREYHCNHCHCRYREGAGYKPGFCSPLCWAQREARDLLRLIERDHLFCSNCFREIKRLGGFEPPGRVTGNRTLYETPDYAVERGYTTTATVDGVKQVQKPVAPTWDEWAYEPTDITRSVAVCSCGCCHHKTTIRPLPVTRIVPTMERLSDVLTALYDREEHSTPHDRKTLEDYAEQYERHFNTRKHSEAGFGEAHMRYCLAHAILAAIR